MASLDGDRRDLPASSTVDGASSPNGRAEQLASRQTDTVGALALLSLGLLLQGSDVVMQQLRQSGVLREAAQADPAETQNGEVTRRALVGLVVETRARAQRRREEARRARRDVFRRLARVAAPIAHWLPVEVALTATEILADYGQRTVEETIARLARQGQFEEEQARVLAQRAILGWINETLSYGTRNPEVRELVTQQGEELATSALDDLRSRTEFIDTWLAQATRKVLKRPTRTRAPVRAETAARAENADAGVTPQTTLSQGGA